MEVGLTHCRRPLAAGPLPVDQLDKTRCGIVESVVHVRATRTAQFELNTLMSMHTNTIGKDVSTSADAVCLLNLSVYKSLFATWAAQNSKSQKQQSE